jgi:hypothetical protein
VQLANKSGSQQVVGAVVIQDTGNDSAFTTTTLERTQVVGVTGETINTNATGAVNIAGLVTVQVAGNVNRGDFLISSGTVGRAKATPISFRAFAIAVTAYAGGGNSTVMAVMIAPQILTPPGVNWAYNNDGTALAYGDPVAIDPSYTSGLAVKMPTSTGDLRVCGVALAPIASGSSGPISMGDNVQSINVTGTVVFGHSLVSSASAHYAQDSGGGGWGPGVIGFALGAQASGTGTISALIKPYPLYYGLGTTIIRSAGNPSVGIGGPLFTSAISDGTNRLMLVFASDSGAISGVAFNAGSFTAFQGNPYFGYLLPSAANANITASSFPNNGSAIEVFLNGVNQGTPVGTYAAASGSSTTPSVTINCNPGDLVVAGFVVQGNATWSVSGRGAGQTNLQDTSANSWEHMVVDYAIATGNNITFTWTLSVSEVWKAVGVAVKSA